MTVSVLATPSRFSKPIINQENVNHLSVAATTIVLPIPWKQLQNVLLVSCRIFTFVVIAIRLTVVLLPFCQVL